MFHLNRPSDRSMPQLSTTRRPQMVECACSVRTEVRTTYFRSKARRAWIRQLLCTCMRSKFRSSSARDGRRYRWLLRGSTLNKVPISRTFFFARGPRPESTRRISSSFFVSCLHFASFTEPDQARRFISARLIKFGTSSGPRYLLLVKTYRFDRWSWIAIQNWNT